LYQPTPEEEAIVETELNVDVPTTVERNALEESARFYESADGLVLTASLLGRREEGTFVSGPVTFVLVGARLVTVRDVNPRAFEVGKGRSSARIAEASRGVDVLIALIEGTIERLADVTSEQVELADSVSEQLFTESQPLNLKKTLRDLGRITSILALTHASLSSLNRLMAFTEPRAEKYHIAEESIRPVRTDIAELERQAEVAQVRVAYLQDAALGLINAKQTDVLKALSLATIAFVPATLVASIFGMNFDFMHWYQRNWGPPVAFALMIIAPLTLFGIARWRKWF